MLKAIVHVVLDIHTDVTYKLIDSDNLYLFWT